MEGFTQTAANPAPPGGRCETLTTADGLKIRCGHWPAKIAEPRGTVLLLQGRTEFIEKHFETIADLLDRGFAVVAFDWRGQGGSERLIANYGHVESFADYDRDLDAVMRHVVLPDCPGPVFALAHSMGALASLRAARDGRARFTRMVLLAPLLALSRHSAPRMSMVRFVSGLGLFLGRDGRGVPNRALRNRQEPGPEPRQQAVEEVLKITPVLRTGRPTARWVYSAARAMQKAEASGFARVIKPPTMLVVAGRDRIVSNEAIKRLAAELRFGAQIIIPGAGHEILMEHDTIRGEFWAAFDAFVPGNDPFVGA